MRNPSARVVEAAATEEIFRRLNTEVDKRFQDINTKLGATDGALSALGGEVQGHVKKTASQVKSLQEDNKNLEEKTASQLKSLQGELKSLQEDNKNLRDEIAEKAAKARQSRGRSASAAMVSPTVAQQFKKPRYTEQKGRASTGLS